MSRRHNRSAGIDGRPVEKIAPRIVCILIRIENVGDAELAHGEHPAIRAASSAQLIGGGLDGFRCPAYVDGLTHECPRQP